MAKDTHSIKCIILTLRNQNVILPDALVAEIISVKEIEEGANGPEWYLGDMKWRGTRVPLMSFEAAGGVEYAKVNLNTQAAILYTVSKDDGEENKHPYIGLVMSGVPHISHFSREQFKFDSDVAEDHPMVAQNVRINGASVSILDIDSMMTMVDDLAA